MDKPNDYPLEQCAAAADKLISEGKGKVEIFQKFTCEKCGARNTMSTPNVFYKSGKCEDCGHETDIVKAGCNYMVSMSGDAPNAMKILTGGYKHVSR